jgi:K+-transporting ATPase KdpF subunit
MSFEDALGLVLAVLALGYLIFALIYPERIG